MMSAGIAATVLAIKQGRPWTFDAGIVSEPSKCIGDRCAAAETRWDTVLPAQGCGASPHLSSRRLVIDLQRVDLDALFTRVFDFDPLKDRQRFFFIYRLFNWTIRFLLEQSFVLRDVKKYILARSSECRKIDATRFFPSFFIFYSSSVVVNA